MNGIERTMIIRWKRYSGDRPLTLRFASAKIGFVGSNYLAPVVLFCFGGRVNIFCGFFSLLTPAGNIDIIIQQIIIITPSHFEYAPREVVT